MNQCVKMSTPANSPGGQSDLWSPEEYSSETIHKLEALPLTTRWTVESTKYKSQQTLGAGRGFSPVWPWASHLPSIWCSFFLCKIFKVKNCGFVLLHSSLILFLTWKRQLKLPNQILSWYRSLPLSIYSFKEKIYIFFSHGTWHVGS